MVRTARIFAVTFAVLAGLPGGMGSARASSPDVPPLDTVLAFSTYLPNGYGPTYQAWAVATDSAGNVYATGSYAPIPYYPYPWPQTAYVMKLSPLGEVLYTTVFPGSGVSLGQAIAVDRLGQAHIAGYTNRDFPQVGGLGPAYRGADWEAFVAKLGPGGEILYSTTLGAAGRERAMGLGVDASGAIYVSGETESRDFPRVGTAPLPGGEDLEIFVAKLVPGRPEPVWSFSFGGSAVDFPEQMAVSPSGRSYVSGYTRSADFPVRSAHQPEHAGESDAFVVSLGPDGDRVHYSTFLGGSGVDIGQAVAVDAAGNAWLGGYTESADFPVLRPLQATKAGFISHYSDGFASGLSPAGVLTFSTYFGGSEIDYVKSLALDRAGNLHLAGTTDSARFPLKDPVQDQCRPASNGRYCPSDVFVATIDPRAPVLVFSTYLGGSERSISYVQPEDFALGIAVDPRGSATVVGGTYSRDFPLVSPIFTSNKAPVHFASFVTRFLPANRPPDCAGATARPSVLWPPNGRMVPVSILGVTDPEGDSVGLKITGITQDEPGANFSGIGSSVARVKAERDGKGDGRVYRIEFEATDPSGASCTGEVMVCVPHDQGKGGCVDSGAQTPSFR